MTKRPKKAFGFYAYNGKTAVLGLIIKSNILEKPPLVRHSHQLWSPRVTVAFCYSDVKWLLQSDLTWITHLRRLPTEHKLVQ